MTPERWQTIKQVLEKALETSAEQRHQLVGELCGGDEDMMAEVLAMLQFEDDESFEVSPITPTDVPHDELIGCQIGNYRVVSELGAGGMGEVYLAERTDGHFEQKVALKLIKTGFKTASIVARFRSERQILASLDHPNIARLIDGGTTPDGLPYLVMEYVDGVPLTEYADKHELGLNERLDLFRQICAAVSYAHQALVIHRDLKPSNILVNSDGTPKLLDFGIAKLITETASGETKTGQLAFSTEYASPEQMRGEHLTTATDVYSLGIILYELLVGERPFCFSDKSFGQILETCTQTVPTRPSSRKNSPSYIPANALKGDLDNIVLKALKKEPERRYSSAEQLSEDVRRYLQGRPIRARRDTWAYRARKFSSRNPLLVGSAALTVLILVAGIAATLYQARNANLERERAERRFNDVRALANSFVFEIDDRITSSPIKARQLLVERAVTYLDSLSRESSTDNDLQAELAAAYAKIGDIQAELFSPNTGDAGAALVSHRKSVELLESLTGRVPQNTDYQSALARSYQKVGNILTITGDLAGAVENYRRSTEVLTRLVSADAEEPDFKRQLSVSYNLLGQATLRSGSLGQCISYYNSSLSLLDGLTAQHPQNKDYRRRRSVTLNYLGYAKLLIGDFGSAVADFDESLAIMKAIYEEDPEDVNSFRYYAMGIHWKGVALREAGRVSESVPLLEEALAFQRKLYEKDRDNLGEVNSLGDCYMELGLTLSKAGLTARAVESFQQALNQYQLVIKSDPSNVSPRQQFALTQRYLGDVLLSASRAAESERYFAEASATFNSLSQKDGTNLEFKHNQAAAYLGLSKCKRVRRDHQSAAQDLLMASTLFDELIQRSPENVIYQGGKMEVATLLAEREFRAAR